MHTKAQVLTILLLSILCVFMLLLVFAHFVVCTSCIVPSHRITSHRITLHRTSMYNQRQKCKNKRHLFFQSLADKKNLFKYEANARASTRNSLHKLHTWCGSQQKIEQNKKKSETKKQQNRKWKKNTQNTKEQPKSGQNDIFLAH